MKKWMIQHNGYKKACSKVVSAMQPYLDYVRRVSKNPIAKIVKLADLRHNSDQTRMENADEATLAYFREKYRKAFEILE